MNYYYNPYFIYIPYLNGGSASGKPPGPTKPDSKPPGPTKSDSKPPGPTKPDSKPPGPTKPDSKPPGPTNPDSKPGPEEKTDSKPGPEESPTETGESPSESDNVIKIEKDPDLDEHRKEALKFFINDNPENYLTSCSEGAKKILMNSIDILENYCNKSVFDKVDDIICQRMHILKGEHIESKISTSNNASDESIDSGQADTGPSVPVGIGPASAGISHSVPVAAGIGPVAAPGIGSVPTGISPSVPADIGPVAAADIKNLSNVYDPYTMQLKQQQEKLRQSMSNQSRQTIRNIHEESADLIKDLKKQ